MFWTNSETKKKTPNMASATSAIVAFATANVLFRNSDRSSIGARWRFSSVTKVSSPRTATPNSERISGEVQPLLFASISE